MSVGTPFTGSETTPEAREQTLGSQEEASDPNLTDGGQQKRRVETTVLLAACLVLLGGGLALRIWLYREPLNSDDVNYMTLSRDFFSASTNVESMRVAFLFLPRIAVAVFGYSLTAFYSSVYVYAVIGALGIFSFAAAFSGLRAAVIVMALWTTSITFFETDTRLVPDNVGIGMSLLALVALAVASELRGIRWSAPRGRWAVVFAFAGGLLVWASYSTRASFGAVILVGALILVLARPSRQVVCWAVAGLAAGFVVEFAWTWAAIGEPFTRTELLFSRGTPAISDPVGDDSVYGGYTWSRIFRRYPDILSTAGGLELAVFFVGGAGAGLWLVRSRREPVDLVKVAALVGFFGIVGFAVTSFDPPVPLMREKLRYYAAAAPLFYLGFADVLTALGGTASRVIVQPIARFTKAHPRTAFLFPQTTLAATIPVLLIAASISMVDGSVVLRSSEAVRRGHDAMLTVASKIRSDASTRGTPKVINSDFRSNRIWGLAFPEVGGWTVRGIEEVSQVNEGYLVLNWHRLNANVRYGYHHASMAYEFDRVIESQPLLFRHNGGPIDVFLATGGPIRRDRFDFSPENALWTRSSDGVRQSVDMDESVAQLGPSDWLYSGAGGLKQPTDEGGIAGTQFIEVVADVGSDQAARLSVELFWHDIDGELRRQAMGHVYGQPGGIEVAAWTYLPEPAVDFRIAFRSKASVPVEISNVQVWGLSRHPLDSAEALSGSWEP